MNKQKGYASLTLIIAIVIAIIGGYLFYKSQRMNSRLSQTQMGIQNDSDLQTVSYDLKNTNIDTIDNGLNQNDLEAASF